MPLRRGESPPERISLILNANPLIIIIMTRLNNVVVAKLHVQGRRTIVRHALKGRACKLKMVLCWLILSLGSSAGRGKGGLARIPIKKNQKRSTNPHFQVTRAFITDHRQAEHRERPGGKIGECLNNGPGSPSALLIPCCLLFCTVTGTPPSSTRVYYPHPPAANHSNRD